MDLRFDALDVFALRLGQVRSGRASRQARYGGQAVVETVGGLRDVVPQELDPGLSELGFRRLGLRRSGARRR